MKSKILAACLALTIPAAAIELSLEENKAERGNIGYIDMHRLFRAYPETLRAKENFEELMRQAEEQLNLRKAEILRLRSELAELKIEREFLSKIQVEASAAVPIIPTADPNAPAPKTPAPKAAPAPKKGTDASKNSAGYVAAAASAKETRDRETTELSKLLEDAKTNPAPPAPAAAEPVRAAPVSPAVVAPAPAPAAPLMAAAPAEGAGRRGSEPETDLTRPSIANLPGFANIPTSSQPARGENGAPNPAAQPAPAAPPPAPVPTGPSEESLREALEQSRRVAEAKRREPLIINIPGVSTAPIVVQPPSAPAVPPTPEVLPSPVTAPQPEAVAVPAVAAPVEPPLNQALLDLEAKIAVKTKELTTKELEYKSEQSSSEKNLIDLESRKTEILLGKIHRAVQDIARKEGVSVVVDKSSILYGHDAVDLTEKVMKHLRGS